MLAKRTKQSGENPQLVPAQDSFDFLSLNLTYLPLLDPIAQERPTSGDREVRLLSRLRSKNSHRYRCR